MHLRYILMSVLPLMASCGRSTIGLQVSSDRDFDTEYEIVSVNTESLPAKIVGSDFVLTDDTGAEVPYQLTYDGCLIFPAKVKAHSAARYTVSKGKAAVADTLAVGALYPDRQDDMAWENDKIGFRAYGPASQRIGDRLYGYDIFLKRNTSRPLIPHFMALNNSPEICGRVDSLRRAGHVDRANALNDSKSYHIDHGYGMDCYAVGPTLGAATTAIVYNDSIIYPWCFESYEILDNGPLRFTVALNYPAVRVGADEVTEHRVISLDAGSHLNCTSVTYEGLSVPRRLITGIVMHEGSDIVSCDPSKRYIAYADPTQGRDNGSIYIGALFVGRPVESKVAVNDGIKHVAAYSDMHDTPSVVYYWGAGWDRSDIPSWQAWIDYLDRASDKLNKPLQVKTK